MWPFRKKALTPIYPFRPLTDALKAKDAELYGKLCRHIPSVFRQEWVKVYPEDFPDGGMSAPDPSSIKPHKDR